jgi:hypothetical protein
MFRLPSLAASLFFLLLSLLSFRLDAADAVYFVVLDEIPVMPGLAELADRSFEFDTPAGRIAEAYASGSVTANQVLTFYGETLPQLGWTPISPGLYRRDGEELMIEVAPESPGVSLRLALSPANASGK